MIGEGFKKKKKKNRENWVPSRGNTVCPNPSLQANQTQGRAGGQSAWSRDSEVRETPEEIQRSFSEVRKGEQRLHHPKQKQSLVGVSTSFTHWALKACLLRVFLNPENGAFSKNFLPDSKQQSSDPATSACRGSSTEGFCISAKTREESLSRHEV